VKHALSQRVAIDASLWDEPTTGIGLYTRCLVQALEEKGGQVVKVGARTSGELPRGRAGKSAFVLGELAERLAELGCSVFHAVGNFNLPLLKPPGTRFVLTVHDLIPELLPDTVSVPFRWQFRLWMTRSLQVADKIICVSERTRDDLLARFDVAPDKLAVVHHGVDHVDAIAPLDSTATRYLSTLNLPERFVLYAGSLDARKNVTLLLEALAIARARGHRIPLVLMGQSWFGSQSAERRVAQMRLDGFDLRPLGYQPAPVFYALMRRASVFVFPSRYEGFGLPPLEAMRLGVPTIVSTAGALPEVCADGALHVSPTNPNELAEALERMLRSSDERARWAQRGKERAKPFTWRRAAEQTLELYRSIASR
jgi:glycosyltransferase involved in cell wall biosynthesis